MTTARREQANALFAELKSVLREVEVEETATVGLIQAAPGGTGPSALVGSLHSLAELCSSRALLYARAAHLLGRLEALWSSEERGGS